MCESVYLLSSHYPGVWSKRKFSPSSISFLLLREREDDEVRQGTEDEARSE